MRLALKLGKTLKQVKAEVSSQELTQWMAFDRIDPFTVNRVELMIARFMALLNYWVTKEKRPAADFLPFHVKPAETAQTMEQKLKAYYGRHQSIIGKSKR